MSEFQGQDRRKWMTVRDVAEMWGVSDDKVRADIKKGALEAYEVCGCVRIRQADALAYGKKKPPTSSTAA